MEPINQRKLDHINIVSEGGAIDRRQTYFDRIHLTHRALPELNLADVDSSCQFLGKDLSFPLLISSMTGGADKELVKINRNLAIAAEAEGVALAIGSQRVFLSDDAARASFELREHAPNALLLGNLGAVQLNYDLGLADCKAAVKVLDADGLYLHLNPLQEAVQPEGDTDFSSLLNKIAEIVRSLKKPVIIKEVGAGISSRDVEHLLAAGIKYIDVAGSGGTSWSMVESKRSDNPSLGELFKDWGIPTPVALRQMKPYRHEVELIASGGIRNGIDMVKSIIFGASLCGVARPFLNPARESAEAVQVAIRRLKREFTTAMFLLGAGCINDIKGREELVLNEYWN
ncbi:type 2 isopentenyl-diphosphate Delta-isomerase [Pontiella sulfatireligans]|uniref:Isopentenyl-diphosphate delta-isomerase n=1 Tax=Pontiella sulfatireligans TaxID=2750658 RepID=A0A6C2UGJ0_9BACT|nr:type 2 isopentenyl-diphosphate Delta-isomerase [Pontiella sulfatireligans]VGO19039.1 Isopentenyl-diphosphate delta-isomerase [Pontiella sulfatireligans]